jgi:hypothetical protein
LDDLTPAEQIAFKKQLDRKFRPIPAIVAGRHRQEKISREWPNKKFSTPFGRQTELI